MYEFRNKYNTIQNVLILTSKRRSKDIKGPYGNILRPKDNHRLPLEDRVNF